MKEGKVVKGGVNRSPKTKRPSPPEGQRGRHNRRSIEPKPFKCECCGATFFERTNRKSIGCIKCKGLAAESKHTIHPPPVWKEVKIKKPFCPRCGSVMKQVTNPDVATMFDWQCTNFMNCHYVC